jgi:hypothetical protein
VGSDKEEFRHLPERRRRGSRAKSPRQEGENESPEKEAEMTSTDPSMEAVNSNRVTINHRSRSTFAVLFGWDIWAMLSLYVRLWSVHLLRTLMKTKKKT